MISLFSALKSATSCTITCLLTWSLPARLYDLVGMTVLSDKDTVGFYDMNSVITVENPAERQG